MATQRIFQTSAIAGATNDIINHPQIIPNGQKWVIDSFGAVDADNGDNISTVYVLRFGTDILRVISVSGNTVEIRPDYEITGNGSDRVNVIVQNKSATAKDYAFWVDAHSI